MQPEATTNGALSLLCREGSGLVGEGSPKRTTAQWEGCWVGHKLTSLISDFPPPGGGVTCSTPCLLDLTYQFLQLSPNSSRIVRSQHWGCPAPCPATGATPGFALATRSGSEGKGQGSLHGMLRGLPTPSAVPCPWGAAAQHCPLQATGGVQRHRR